MTSEDLKTGLADLAFRALDRFGVAVIVLGVVLYFAREAAIAVHSSVVEPVVKSHVEFLESTKATMTQQAETLQELARGQQEIQQVLARPTNTEGAN